MVFEYSKPVFLASKSLRRQDLLNQLGIQFEVLPVDIDESVLNDESPLAYVKRMAEEKAISAWQMHQNNFKDLSNVALLSADTSVILGEKILGKPVTELEAREMLASLSAKKHQVITSVALKNQQGLKLETSVTQVEFAQLSNSTIDAYCLTQEGADKAGAYAIQGMAAQFICSINGSYSGVVGLPLFETSLLLQSHLKDCL